MRARVKVPIHLRTLCVLRRWSGNCCIVIRQPPFLPLALSLCTAAADTKIEIEIFDMMMMIVNGVVLCVYVCCASFIFQRTLGDPGSRVIVLLTVTSLSQKGLSAQLPNPYASEMLERCLFLGLFYRILQFFQRK